MCGPCICVYVVRSCGAQYKSWPIGGHVEEASSVCMAVGIATIHM